jgi:hypothetical protein
MYNWRPLSAYSEVIVESKFMPPDASAVCNTSTSACTVISCAISPTSSLKSRSSFCATRTVTFSFFALRKPVTETSTL